MYKIVLLGTGNVATHLFKAFQNSDRAAVVQIYNHREESLAPFKKKVATTTQITELLPADLYLVSVSDNVVPQLIGELQLKNALVAHTAGSVPLLKKADRNGVFYPLQTFTKARKLDFKKIPLCLEADSSDDFTLLREIARSITPKVYPINSDQRKTLHLAAAFASNFTNHLYRIAEKICHQNSVPFEIMYPLIEETALKIQQINPLEGQTGPAVRGDSQTISKHLNELDSPELKEIYTLLTKSIQKENE